LQRKPAGCNVALKGIFMKRILSLVLHVGFISLCGLNTCRASDYVASAFDVSVVRPIGFAATAVGSVFFVVALPFAAASHGVKETGDTLVVTPAQFTFTRPVGDFSSHKNDANEAASSAFMPGPATRQVRNSDLSSEKAGRKKATNQRKPSLTPTALSPLTQQFKGT
jgi:hypothetical protein